MYNNKNSKSDYEKYIIKKGDSLDKISKNLKIPITELLKINDLKNPNLIFAGASLNVPVTSTKEIPKYLKKVEKSSPKTFNSVSTIPLSTKSNEKPSLPVNKQRPLVNKKQSVNKVPYYLNQQSVNDIANFNVRDTYDPKYAFNKALLNGNYIPADSESEVLNYASEVWNKSNRPEIKYLKNNSKKSYFKQNVINLFNKNALLEELAHAKQYATLGANEFNKRANFEKMQSPSSHKHLGDHYFQPGSIENEAHSVISRDFRKDLLLNVKKGFVDSLPANQKKQVIDNLNKYGQAIVTDKTNNETIILGINNDNSIVAKKIPVITGQNYNSDGVHSYEELEKEVSKRGTPVGDFEMRYDQDIYGKPGYRLLGAKDIAVHRTYPGESARRNPLYDNPNPKTRRASWGCINCRDNDLDYFHNLYVDPLKPRTMSIIKQHGGLVNNKFQNGGYYYNPNKILPKPSFNNMTVSTYSGTTPVSNPGFTKMNQPKGKPIGNFQKPKILDRFKTIPNPVEQNVQRIKPVVQNIPRETTYQEMNPVYDSYYPQNQIVYREEPMLTQQFLNNQMLMNDVYQQSPFYKLLNQSKYLINKPFLQGLSRKDKIIANLFK